MFIQRYCKFLGRSQFIVKHDNLGKGLNNDINDFFTSGISDLETSESLVTNRSSRLPNWRPDLNTLCEP